MRTDTADLDPWDRALLRALESDDETTEPAIALDELARRTGLSPTLLETLERAGLLLPRSAVPEPRYEPSDAEAVRAGLELVEAGLPLAELLDLARRTDEAMRGVAREAVDAFARFVRDSVEAAASSEDEAAERLVAAFRAMLPATSRLVSHHFRRLLVVEARRRIEGGAQE